MIPGRPGGRQFAVGPSADARGMSFIFAAYAGVRDGPAGAAARPPPPPRPRPALAPPPAAGAAAPRAARPPPPPPPASHTPLKSGSFAMAAQSAAVGDLVIAF